jgi:hypothetical protein
MIAIDLRLSPAVRMPLQSPQRSHCDLLPPSGLAGHMISPGNKSAPAVRTRTVRDPAACASAWSRGESRDAIKYGR